MALKKTLYNIVENFKAFDMLLREYSELPKGEQKQQRENLISILSDLKGDITEKAKGIKSFDDNIGLEIERYERLEKEAKARKLALKNVRDRLHERTVENLKEYFSHTETKNNSVGEAGAVLKLHKNPPSVVIRDEGGFIEKHKGTEYVTQVVTYSINKNAINKALSDGKNVSGAERVVKHRLKIGV